ncbi:antitoxin [Nocardioides marmoriginsengisoli]|uniref:Antitoxin n=2 Tax=Nocardioides marmoriginsengisoli TaxID=661483 RepID=A0A3N0CD76_9ACTN|nr:antitoxin [Nocardioides marmoriginsengisoli]
MTMTTIKVSTETRDRLKAQASAAHVSLGEHLTRLAAAADRGLRFEALRSAIAATPSDLTPEDHAWLDADLDV